MAKLNIINRITSDYDQGRITDVMRDVQETVNKNIEGDKNQTFQVAPATTGTMAPQFQQFTASSGSSNVGFLQSGTGAVASTVQDKDRESLTWKDFMTAAQVADVEAGTTLIDVTTAVKAAITYSQITKRKVKPSWGNFLITDSLSIATGTQIEGETEYQYINGFGVAPKATTITFAPTTQKSLFVADGATVGSFRFHISVKNLFISGNSVRAGATTSLYAFDLQSVIYAHFENIGITGFNTPIKCTSTINNRFVNVYCNGTVSALIYSGSLETTDVWEQCSFWGSPLGVSFLGSSIGIRFSKCLWEQIDTYGMDVAKECQAIMVEDCYSEDSPFTVSATNCMFRVGYTGTALAGPTSLQVKGGVYTGRGAGNTGSFLDCNYANGVQLIGIYAARFTNLILTSANTSNWAISCSGIQWLSITNNWNDTTKLSGSLDFQAVNSATGQVGWYAAIHATTLYGALSGSVSGVTDGSAAGAGIVGEIISSAVSGVAAPTSGQYKDLTSIALTAGSWSISLNEEIANGGSVVTSWTLGIGTATGNSSTGLTFGDTQLQPLPPTAASDSCGTVANVIKNISGSTTYYAKISCVWAGGAPTFSGRITATRIR